MDWTKFVLFLALSLPLSASTLDVFYQVTSLGGNSYRYDYALQNYSFLEGDELAIEFPADQYASISNGEPSASPDWDLLLFAPNSPPGAAGVYSLYALVDAPDVTVAFSVDFSWMGVGAPAAQTFSLNRYDPNTGEFLEIAQQGITRMEGAAAVPEPSSTLLLLPGMLLILFRGFKTARSPRR